MTPNAQDQPRPTAIMNDQNSTDKPEAQPALAASACSAADLRVALHESVKLQSHYAKLLNRWDGGARIGFEDADAWIARLRETGTLPNVKLTHGEKESQ